MTSTHESGEPDIRHGYDMALWTGDFYWNPLEDDGDALRLAVRLHLDVLTRICDRETWAQAPMQKTVVESWGADACAATRRAIVRAAAALGAQSGAPQPPDPDTK